MAKIKNYEILQKLNSNPDIEVYRGFDPANKRNIILKNIPVNDEFDSSVVNLKNEYEVMKYLGEESGRMLKAFSFERHEDGFLLTMEDTEGKSLKEIQKDRKISIEEFFLISIELAEVLLQIHKKKVIHKDIKPDNIILNNELKNLRIIDFGISTRLSKVETKWSAPNVLEGSIYYISPEQTGRMNRAVDYRSDFYSLGITFYELLCGKLPFISTDLLELVHFHLAKNPPPVQTIREEIPLALSKIITKLISKTAENRYQTAIGLKHDLERCKNLYDEAIKLNKSFTGIDFELGEKDISDEFTIQQKLYGRDADIEKLMKAFEAVSNSGRSEIILIAGYSGVGKSSLVKEISKPITESKGYFLSGKYDQYNKNMPFSAIIQAFTNVVRLILTELPEQINKWKEELISALGNNGKILTDVIPELEYIIGHQPEVVELGAQENANRFYLVFQNFIKVLSNENHPLAIFLDDLQWADSASLALIQNLIEDDSVKYLFFMLAYRDNEVDGTHPFQLLIDDLKKSSFKLEKLILKPLDIENIQLILQDSLHSSSGEVSEIATIVHSKTGGNPFFINEFLKQLYKDDLIYFNYEHASWKWKLEEIKKIKVSENVVDLLIEKILKLEDSTQEILKLTSCIGNIFDLATLSLINKKSILETSNELKNAINSEMIVPIGDTYRLVDTMVETPENSKLNLKTAKSIKYRFQHDRVQQASYELLENERKFKLRLEIGRILYNNTEITKKEEAIFDIVNHFNTGIEYITDKNEYSLLINLNLQAGKKAKISTAYKPAREYLSIAYSILSKIYGEDNAWKENYNLSLSISKEYAEVEYLTGNFESSEKMVKKILEKANNLLDRSEAYNLLMIQYSAMGQFKLATETIRKALEPLEVVLPENNYEFYINEDINKINDYLKNKSIMSLIELPQMKDPIQIIKVKLLMNTYVTAYNTVPELASIISLKLVNLYLKYGNLTEAWGYSSYSIYLTTALNKYKEAYDFSYLSMQISQKYGDLAGQAKAANIMANYANPWIKPIKESEYINKTGIQSALDSGEFLHGSYSALHYVINSFYQGKLINTIYNEYNNYLQFSTRAKNHMAIDTINGAAIALSNLLGKSSDRYNFSNNDLTEEMYLNICKEHQSLYPV